MPDTMRAACARASGNRAANASGAAHLPLLVGPQRAVHATDDDVEVALLLERESHVLQLLAGAFGGMRGAREGTRAAPAFSSSGEASLPSCS